MLGLVEKVVIGCQHLAGFLGGREPSLDRPQPGTKHTALGLGSFQQKPTAAATAWHAVLGTGQWTSPWLFRRIPVCLPPCSPERGLPVLGPQPPALTSPSQSLPLWTGRAVPKPGWLESPPKASGRGFLPALGLRGGEKLRGGEPGAQSARRRPRKQPACHCPLHSTKQASGHSVLVSAKPWGRNEPGFLISPTGNTGDDLNLRKATDHATAVGT